MAVRNGCQLRTTITPPSPLLRLSALDLAIKAAHPPRTNQEPADLNSQTRAAVLVQAILQLHPRAIEQGCRWPQQTVVFDWPLETGRVWHPPAAVLPTEMGAARPLQLVLLRYARACAMLSVLQRLAWAKAVAARRSTRRPFISPYLLVTEAPTASTDRAQDEQGSFTAATGVPLFAVLVAPCLVSAQSATCGSVAETGVLNRMIAQGQAGHSEEHSLLRRGGDGADRDKEQSQRRKKRQSHDRHRQKKRRRAGSTS